ncbi:MAG: FCD domain-containing protein [Pseudomonas sp.]
MRFSPALRLDERIQLYVAEHRLIYEAIAEGDGDAAASLC